jgi:hypothetical protein
MTVLILIVAISVAAALVAYGVSKKKPTSQVQEIAKPVEVLVQAEEPKAKKELVLKPKPKQQPQAKKQAKSAPKQKAVKTEEKKQAKGKQTQNKQTKKSK